jgi:thiol-disulfide isomerase/thioredoxin
MAIGRATLVAMTIAAIAAIAGYFMYARTLGVSADRQALAAQAYATASFADLAGKPRKLSEWNGQVVVVNFWATWCAPCREEIPGLIETRGRYAAKGLEVVGIAIDSPEKASGFARDYRIDYPILVGDATGIALMRSLGNATGALPYTVVVDRSGQLVAHHLGLLTPDQLFRYVAPLLP